MSFPSIIQGGMGVGVSNWQLARAVSREGQLGVVSGTLLAVVLARRLQLGDPAGDSRRAMAAFPLPAVADRVLKAYFIPGGKAPDAPFKLTPMPSAQPSGAWWELAVLGSFVEVYLAKEGHSGVVGMNLLEKIQIGNLAGLYGGMLAGVDYILMGAGIPRAIPGVLDHFAAGEAASLRIDVEGAPVGGTETLAHFDPAAFFGGTAPKLKRPAFLAIVSSATLALTLAKKSSGRVDGFVVEGLAAGGHNAPPRGPMQLSETGEPIYGERDVADLVKIKAIGLPFWLAGAHASRERVAEAIAAGATGVQVGTAFAFCEESGITPELKRAALANSLAGLAKVRTDPRASPTGFPFKVLQQAGTLADPAVSGGRQRICDLGYLRLAYQKDDGTVGYRCPAEPVENYVAKGGNAADCDGRQCLCNSLCATVGLAQTDADGTVELPLITAGTDALEIARFLAPGADRYYAADVLRAMLPERSS